MNDEELARRAHGLLKELLELEAGPQQRRLDESCAGDPRLRREVELLLASSVEAGRFLEDSALDTELGDLGSQGFVGQQVGNYVLEERLGVGGMGTVFRARELDPARQVALKLMNPGSVDQQSLRRFQTEIRILAQLDHPGIARLFTSGSWDAGFGGVPWYTMEWIQEGRRLTDFVREEGLAQDQVLDLFRQVCEAVHYGHQRGILHRDLKPSNLLVDGVGRPRVIDFGVACFLDPQHQTVHRTTFGGIIGTVGYMSPEQLQEDGGQADVRTDVYALGVVLYELLTGSHPHDLQDTNLVQAMRIVREGVPRKPSAINPRLRGDLEAILCKATEQDRERRYQSVESFQRDLRRYQEHEPVRASPPSRLRQALFLARRHRAWVVSGSVVAAVLLIASIVSTILALRLSDEVKRRKNAQSEVERERDEQAHDAYRANVMAAEGFWRAGEVVSMRARLAQTRPELRDWEWQFLQRLAWPAEWVMAEHQGRVRAVAYSNDGTRVASVGEDGLLVVSWPGTDRTQQMDVLESRASVVAWSKDDQRIAVGSLEGEIREVDVGAWRVVYSERPHQDHVTALTYDESRGLLSCGWDGSVRFTPEDRSQTRLLSDGWMRLRDAASSRDGARLALVCESGTVAVLDQQSGKTLHRFEHAGPMCVTFQADGQGLWIGTESGAVESWSLDGEADRSVSVHRREVRDLVLHPSGRALLSCSGDHSAAVTTLPDLTPRAWYRGHEETVQAAVWSPDGETVVTSSWDGTLQSIATATLEDPRALWKHEQQVHALAWSHDGSLLASASDDGSVVLWDFGGRRMRWRGAEHEASVRTLCFGPDDQWLASGSLDGRVGLWDVDRGQLLRFLEPEVGRIYALEFLDDGRLLVAGQDGRVRRYEAGLEVIEQTWVGHENWVWDLAVDPSRPQVASASMDGTIRLWSLVDDTCRILRGHADGVYCLEFRTDGVLASGGRDQRLCLWDGGTGKLLHENQTHGQFITGLDWRPDGKRLVTGSWFETLKVWEPEPLRELLTIHDHPTAVREVRFSPGGQWILSGGGEGQIQLWDGRPLLPSPEQD